VSRSVVAVENERLDRILAALERIVRECAPAPLERYYSPEVLAKRLDVPAATLREWARRGTLPSVRLGKLVRFRESDVRAFLDGGRS
jgi:excisionase family DNA binding protein